MLIYSGIAILFLIFIFVITRKIKWAFRIPFLLILLVITYFFLSYFKESVRAVDELQWFEIGPWKHILLFVCMLLGMATNYFYDYIQARIKAKEAKESGEEMVIMPRLMWEKLVLPFIISVLLFGYFWGEYGQGNMNLPAIFACYQNGFFWQTILMKVKQK